MNMALIDSSSFRTHFMRKPDKPVIVSIALAALMGVLLGGFMLNYKGFFVTTAGLWSVLVVPGLFLGLIAGWWCWISILVLLSTTSLLLYLRALAGRELNLYYLFFAFGLTVVPIWEYAIYTFMAAYAAAVIRMLCLTTFFWASKWRNPPKEPAADSPDLLA